MILARRGGTGREIKEAGTNYDPAGGPDAN